MDPRATPEPPTPPPTQGGLTTAEAEARLRQYGENAVREERAHPLRRLAGKFWGLSAWMLELIVVLSWALHKRADTWVAALLLVVNAALGFLQEQRASAALAALRQRLEITARVLRDGVWRTLSARQLVPDDVVRLRGGDFVPADVTLVDGALRIDESALTGESRELERAAGAEVRSGSVVRRGEASARVTATGTRTFFGRSTQLVAAAHPKLHVEEVIGRVVRWLLLIVGVLVAVTAALALARGGRLADILPLSLVLLMSAVPVALPVMFTVTMALGSLELAKEGVLVTRLSASEDAANLDVVCADKTGTLTQNRLTLTAVVPQPKFRADDVVGDGAAASEEADRDPIDVAFLEAARARKLDGGWRTVSFVPFSPESRHTEAVVARDGQTRRVYKGAVGTLAQLAGLDEAETRALEAGAAEAASSGERALAVARADGDGKPELVGLALLSDPPRADSRALVDELHRLGIRVKMLTGDALPVARAVAQKLGLGDVVRAPELRGGDDVTAARLVHDHGGFAEVFPEDKYRVVELLQRRGHVVGMTGDGVNDAPALRQAEVGIAVAGATDVAKGAASVVLTQEGLGGIVDLVKIGRAIYQRVLTWIINKISSTVLKAGVVVLAYLATGRFVISALAMVLLVFMTDFVKIALSTDHVRRSSTPETWDIAPLVRVGVALGVAMLFEALALLALAWRPLALAADPGRLQTFTFEVLLFFSVFAIVSLRERRGFWASAPSAVLVLALAGDALAGVAIGRLGLAELHPVSLGATALIVGWSAVACLGVNDVVKRLLIRRADRRAGARAAAPSR